MDAPLTFGMTPLYQCAVNLRLALESAAAPMLRCPL